MTDDGLEAVEAACREALAAELCSADAVLNILSRRHANADVEATATPTALVLAETPATDCARYDRLREAGHGAR